MRLPAVFGAYFPGIPGQLMICSDSGNGSSGRKEAILKIMQPSGRLLHVRDSNGLAGAVLMMVLIGGALWNKWCISDWEMVLKCFAFAALSASGFVSHT